MTAPDRPRWDIGDVLARTDLSVLLDEFTQPVGRSGPGRRWHCPVEGHADENASVSMYRDKHGHERWRCWSADHRGDAVDLVMMRTGQDRIEAIDWLATRAGMFPDRPLPAIPKRSSAQEAAVAMDPVVGRYVALCEAVLHGPQGRPVVEWLHARGLDDETIRANRLGADPSRDFMRRQRGLPVGAGVAAVFPAFDPVGNLTYVQARYLDPEAAGRKYDNPSSALAPHPRLAWPAADGERAGVLLVCEGIPDSLIAAQAGFRSVALLGARSPDESVAIRLVNAAEQYDLDLALVADNDDAGRGLATTLTRLVSDLDADLLVVTPPDGMDLNAWALSDDTWSRDLYGMLREDVALTASADVAVEMEVAGW